MTMITANAKMYEMRISEFIRNSDARVSYGNRWLVWDDGWIVYERLPYKKRTTEILVTLIEEHAVAALLGKEKS